MQQRPGQSKPLALTAGKIASLFKYRRFKPLLSRHKSKKIHPLKSRKQLSLRCIRLAHAKIFFDSSFKKIAVMTDQRNRLHTTFLRQF